MAQAVLTFNPHNGWSTNIKFPVKRKLHAVMQICGSSLAIAGTAVQMANVFNNLRSTHGIFGKLHYFFCKQLSKVRFLITSKSNGGRGFVDCKVYRFVVNNVFFLFLAIRRLNVSRSKIV